MSLDGFSMHALAKELNEKIAGGRIDRIFQPSKQSVTLSIRQPGENFFFHISIQSNNPAAYLIEKPLENPSEPPVFCMVLRKQLETGRIASLRQHGLDRLFLLEVDTLGVGGSIVTKTLAIELMGKYSNIILTENGVIVDALRKIGTNSSRVRTVLPNQPYALPPCQEKLNLLSAPIADILTAIRAKGEEKLSKSILASCMGFGPVSAKEAAFSAGLSPNVPIGQLDAADFASLKNALLALKDAISAPAPMFAEENGKLLALAAFPLHFLPAAKATHFPTISALLSAVSRRAGSYVLPDQDRFRRLVKNEKNRAEGKLLKLQEEHHAAENAEQYKIYGDNLMTYQYALDDHAGKEARVQNIYSETGDTIVIPLDPKFTILQNMQLCYKKYDKLKRAQNMLLEQIEKCAQEIRYLASIDTSLTSSSTLAEIAEIHNELIDAGYLHEKHKKKNKDKPSLPFHFRAKDGTSILIGKNNYQNDQLTFKTAAYNDLWFHTKDIPGSHVILRTGGNPPQEETILAAAMFAAHFSSAQGSSKIPVDYTECRYVRKPSGSRPGFVIFTHQKTLYITPDEEQLKELASPC